MIAVRFKNAGEVVREMIFHKFPVRLGRGMENDVILFDDSVSKTHAVIEPAGNGRFLLRDLESTNGTRVAGEGSVRSHVFDKRVDCFLGMAELEIESLSDEVTREVDLQEIGRFNRRRSFKHHVRMVFLGLGGGAAYQLLKPDFWSPQQTNRMVSFLENSLVVLVGVPVLAFVLLIMLRSLGRKIRIADTIETVARLIWFLPLLSVLSFVGYYLLPSGPASFVRVLMAAMVFITVVLTVAELRRRPLSTRFRITWIMGAALLFLAVSGTSVYSRRKSGNPQTDYSLLPPLGSFVGPSVDLSAHIARIGEQARKAGKAAGRVEYHAGQGDNP